MKYLIFDVDGTLLDSDNTIVRCMKESSKRFGYNVDHIRENIGVRKLEDILVMNRVPSDKIPLIINDYKICYENTFRIDTAPVDDSPEILKVLGNNNKLGVITYKYYRLTKMLLAEFFRDVHFYYIYCGDYPFALKDKADALKIIASEAGDPRNVYYIGDRKKDMDSARSVGVRAVWASFGLGGGDTGIEYDMKIDSFSDLLGI